MTGKLVAWVKVWDIPIRIFHWFLVASFSAAYLSAKFHMAFLHQLAGYFICGLLLARLYWGFVGTPYARFRSFLFSPTDTFAYLRSLVQGKPQHFLGHNPAGAVMVFALFSLLLLLSLSGLLTLALIDFDGPLFFLANYFDDEFSYFIRHLHGWLVDSALFLIALHLLGVAISSLQHHENLLKAMFTGQKQKK